MKLSELKTIVKQCLSTTECPSEEFCLRQFEATLTPALALELIGLIESAEKMAIGLVTIRTHDYGAGNFLKALRKVEEQ